MFSVNYRDPRPIYEQVKDGMRRAVLTGMLMPDDKVPSVREMAAQLVINPNTIQKAYRELENEGYIYSVPGKGSFVTDSSRAKNQRKEELFAELDKTVSELAQIGVGAAAVCAHISVRIKEGEKADD